MTFPLAVKSRWWWVLRLPHVPCCRPWPELLWNWQFHSSIPIACVLAKNLPFPSPVSVINPGYQLSTEDFYSSARVRAGKLHVEAGGARGWVDGDEPPSVRSESHSHTWALRCVWSPFMPEQVLWTSDLLVKNYNLEGCLLNARGLLFRVYRLFFLPFPSPAFLTPSLPFSLFLFNSTSIMWKDVSTRWVPIRTEPLLWAPDSVPGIRSDTPGRNSQWSEWMKRTQQKVPLLLPHVTITTRLLLFYLSWQNPLLSELAWFNFLSGASLS